MGSNYKSLRCHGCDGTLEYNKEKKVWICIYCGNEIHREEQYDGLYTIKNVVKQVLVDLAYGRLDSAQKNVIECEKIASSYVGTMIAQLCMKVFLLITPGACQNSEVKSLYGQIKRIKEKIDALDSGISTEEEALYEEIDGNNDALGVLLLVYDTIKADVHLNFVENFFDASTVYSVGLNANLLSYALKNNKEDIVDKIFANSDNINCRKSSFILLKSYKDCSEKREYVKAMFSKAEFLPDDYKEIERYLEETADCVETRAEVYINAAKYHVAPAIRTIMDHILADEQITLEQIEAVIGAFCGTRPKDAELYELVDEIYTKHGGAAANREMQILIESKIFIKPSGKIMRVMLDREDWTVSDRISMLELSEQCKIDAKTNDAILSNLLLNNKESTEVRMALIEKMTEYVDTISTVSMTEYILKCNRDGEQKPQVLELLLNLNLNMSFFREVLSKYMQTTIDSAEVKRQIAQMLSEKGLHVDADILLDVACKAQEENYMEAVAFIQSSLNNGARMDYDALGKYLETVKPEEYRSELISVLYTSASRISDLALAKYVLYATDGYDVKLQNSRTLAEQNGKAFGTTSCQIRFLGMQVQCNLLQAYVLVSDDSAVVADALVSEMKSSGAKLNPNILVNGQSMKFKKLAADYKIQLSPVSLELCEKNKVFSFFF